MSDFIKQCFENSENQGKLFSNGKRSYSYVLHKAVEEMGELSEEILIEQGFSYKNKGADGIGGESVDLAIVAMDMFYLHNSHLSASEISELFMKTVEKKRQKWIDVTSGRYNKPVGV